MLPPDPHRQALKRKPRAFELLFRHDDPPPQFVSRTGTIPERRHSVKHGGQGVDSQRHDRPYRKVDDEDFHMCGVKAQVRGRRGLDSREVRQQGFPDRNEDNAKREK